jgi:hypothetical protein
MKLRQIVAAVSMYHLCMVSFAAEEVTRSTVMVQAGVKAGTVEFIVRNPLESEIEIAAHLLPWGYWSSVWASVETFNPKCKKLVVYAQLESVPLEKQYVAIPPSSEIKGTVSLHDRIPGLREKRTGCQDVLFWSYELLGRSGRHFGRYSGTVELNGGE